MDNGASLCLLFKDVGSETKSEDDLRVNCNSGEVIFDEKVYLPSIGPAWSARKISGWYGI